MRTINKLFVLLVAITSLSAYANLVTNLEGEVKVNNGYLSYTTPLAPPQGINKLSPNLSINYTQGSGSSPLGLGFKLSGLSAVSRCAKSEKIDGIEHGVLLSEEDAYCLDGVRLIKVSGNEYRLINNANIKATLNNNAWTVHYPSGINKKFDAANNYNNKILNWNLATTKDKFNNTIDYAYTVDSNIHYINTISYNNHKLTFNYKNSPHQYTSYRFGTKHQHNKLLDNITIHTNNNLLKTYKLDYQTGTTYSRLHEITFCDGNNTCTKPLTFGYKQIKSNNISYIIAQNPDLDIVEDDIVSANETKYEEIVANANEVLNYGVADFNNDGDNDACYLDNTGLNCAIGNGSGKFSSFSKWTNALSDSNWHKLEHSTNLSFIDINLDGWTDYCSVDDKGVFCGLNSKNNSFIGDKYWSTVANVESALRFIDINKDDLVDLCYFGDSGIYCANNNGSGFGSEYQHSSLVFDIELKAKPIVVSATSGELERQKVARKNAEMHKIPQPQFLDTNADGILDICGFKNNVYQCAIGYKNSSNNFVYNNPTDFISDLNLQNYSKKELERFNNTFRLADLNNDGLVDLCYRDKTNLEYACHLNTGSNYTEKSTWLTLPNEMAYTSNGFADNYDNSIHFSDENADGLTDFCTIIADKRWCYNNTNNGFSQSVSKILLDVDLNAINKTTNDYTRPLKELFGLKTTFHTLIVNARYGPFKTTADLNNDGWGDFCYRSYGGLNCVYEEKQPVALLNKVTNSFGLATTINYEKLNNVNYTSSTSNHPVISTTPQLNLVSSIVVDTPTGKTNQANYHYSGYKYHLDDGSLGFESLSVTNPSKNTVVTIKYEQDKEDLIGSIVESSTTVDGVLTYKKQNEYQLAQPYNKVKNIQITKATESFYENNTLSKQISSEYSNYNGHNQAQKIVETKSNNLGQSLVTTSIGQYTQDTNNWLLNLPTNLEVTHRRDGQTTTRKTTYTYNSGNLVSQTIQPDSVLALTTNYEYNAQGLASKTTSTDKNGNTKTVSKTYDSFGKITSATDALGQTAHNSYYNDKCLLTKQSTTIDGLSVQFTYDSLCRIKTKTDATGEVITYTYDWSDGAELGTDYQSLGLNLKDSSIYSVIVSSNTGGWHKTYYNAIGKKVREVALIDNDKHSITDIVYDKHGNIKAQSLPYFEGLFAGGNVAWSVYEYDNKNRIIQAKTPNEYGEYININTAYGANTITNNNQGQITKTTKDISGEDKSIVKNNQQTINYSYDAIGNLTKTDKDNSIITLEYNDLGNKTKSIDPAMGTWSYVYNAFGELTQQTDGKGQITSIEYDKLGRIVKKTLAGQVSTWSYDDKGRLLSESKATSGTQTVGKSYSYDSLSRLNEVTLSVTDNNNTQDFTTKYEYDESSRIKTIAYPDGFTEHKDYTLSGGVKRVSVPKNDVWDYDYLSLEKSLAETAIRIAQLNKEAEDLEAKAQEYLDEAAKYEHYAENYQRTSNSYENYANRLDGYSDRYYKYYQNYQRVADSYRAKANYYYRKFGNATLTYVKTVNGKHHYRNTDCTSKNWKGSCRRQNSYHAYIPTEMISNQRVCKQKGSSKNRYWHCYYAPQRKINVSQVYNKRADYYQRRANLYKHYSEYYAGRSNYYQQRSDEIQEKANEALETANNYKQQASEQTTQLSKVMNELEDQKNTQQELQTVLNNRLSDTTKVALWTATSYDAYNKPKGILHGNGLLTRNVYNPHNNNLTSIEIGRGGDLINNMSYSYDNHNNITSIANSITDESHTYSYDDMDRITNWQYSNNSHSTSKYYTFDNQNNLTFKTGTGTMMYNTANQLTSRIDTNAHTHTYQYDVNGNQLSSTSNANNSNRAITYTTFNKTKRLTTQTPNGFEINEISYDANHKRIIQKAYYDTNTTANNPNKTTYHINKGYAVIYTTDNQNNDVTIHRHNIFVNGKVVTTYDKTLINNAKAVDQAAYMHTDALGNIVTVTGNDGEVRLRQATTPFGETITQGLINNTATGHFQKDDLRGYTGHEQLPRHSIINMNARLYDPLTTRFLSADSLIPDSKDPLAYNRYIYVRNNPLKYTDPTGHWWQIAVAIALMTISATTDDPTTAKVTAIAGMLLMGGALAGEGGAGLSAAESGAVVGFTQGTLNSANLGEGVKQGVISGITAAAVNEIAHGGANGTSEFSDLEQLALQGLVGGISTELRGGRFQDGIVSAIVSKGVDLGLEGQQLDFYTEGAIAMIAGGLAAKAGGGSFEDGAVQAGMVHLYNAWGTIIQYGVKAGKELFKKGSRSGFKSDRVLNNLKIKGKKVSTDIEKGSSGLNNIHLKVGKTKYYYDGKSFYTPNGVRVPKSVLKNNAVQKTLQKALDLHAKGF